MWQVKSVRFSRGQWEIGKTFRLRMYLQSTGGGAKSLMVPSQSTAFQWTAEQVSRLSGQKGTIYILAEADLILPLDVKVHAMYMQHKHAPQLALLHWKTKTLVCLYVCD